MSRSSSIIQFGETGFPPNWVETNRNLSLHTSKSVSSVSSVLTHTSLKVDWARERTHVTSQL